MANEGTPLLKLVFRRATSRGLLQMRDLAVVNVLDQQDIVQFGHIGSQTNLYIVRGLILV